MSLSIGIVGLPNAGKSTLFNALVKAHQAKVANYPFTTIEPNVGVVEVPDSRLQQIADRLQLNKIIPATIKFIDIAGLVKNAHQGEGLGNKFLAHIRETNAIVHILRGFEDPNVEGTTNPKDDLETVKIELQLAEINKPTLYVLNVAEKDLGKKPTEYSLPPETLILSAKLESELIDLPPSEAKAYLESLGLQEPILPRLIQAAFKLLNLITFYTLLPDQIQAWPILRDTLAPAAAGKVHTDMEKGFIAAEVVAFPELISIGNWQAAHAAGKIRTEGKDYVIVDGDVIHFKFAT